MEGMQEGSWEEQQKKMSPDFHLDEREDPVEALIKKIGWEDALAQINDNLDANPEDAEARRQANLAKVLLEKEVKILNDKLLH